MNIVETYTQSALVTHAECPEKYRLSYKEGGNGIQPRVPDVRMFMGNVLNEALRLMYTYKGINHANRAINHMFDSYISQHHHSPPNLQNIEIARYTQLGAAAGYFKHYRKEIYKHGKLWMSEFEVPINFTLVIKGKGYRFRGSIDAIGTYNKRECLVETKNTAQISGEFKFDVEMSPQTLLYLVGYYETYRPKSDVATIFNYVRKPSIRPRRGESPAMFMQRVQDDYISRPDFYFHRAVIRRSVEDLLRFKQELIAYVRTNQFIQKKNLWYKNRKACNARGRCSFFDICSNGPIPGVMANFKNKLTPHPELEEVMAGVTPHKKK